MSDTPNLKLPFIMEAQAQKHVTHNDAIRALDALVQLGVLDRDLTAPPQAPADGDRYIIATGATGVWATMDGQIAAFQDGTWTFYPPHKGWLAWVADENQLYVHDGASWGRLGDSDLQNIPMLGVNAAGDSTNRLSVSAAATLLNHEGAGHQLKINKNSVADTASVLFQNAFSGRAEFGLLGDDDWHVKISADGNVWNEALVADRNTGNVDFKADVTKAGVQLMRVSDKASDTDLFDGLNSTSFVRKDAGTSQHIDVGADDFYVQQSTGGVQFVIWWDVSSKTLYLGTQPSGGGGNVTFRAPVNSIYSADFGLLTVGGNHVLDDTDIGVANGVASLDGTIKLPVAQLPVVPVTALADGVTIIPDFSKLKFSLVLGGNRTLANPTNLVAGQEGFIIVTQDATGGRTLAFGSQYKWPGGGAAPALSAAGGSVDVIKYMVKSTTEILCELATDYA